MKKIRWWNQYYEVYFDYVRVAFGEIAVYTIKDLETGKFLEKNTGETWYDQTESRAIGYAEELTENKIFEKVVLDNE